MRVFITGATGFIGQAIIAALRERGDTVVALTRSRKKAEALWPGASLEIVEGDSSYEGGWQDAVAGCDAAINLAGEPMDGARWDALYRQKLRDSRIDCTRFLSEAILRADADRRPGVLVSASGIDYYGFAELEGFDEDEVTESDPGGESFLAALCWDWEDETRPCKEAGVRVARMRTGMVLGKRGALPRLAEPFRRGFGGRIGSGRQWMSWIHIADVVGAYLFALDNELAGPVNLVAPGNVRNREFARTLGKILGRKSWLPAPTFAVNLVAGQLHEYVVKGRRAAPGVLRSAAYAFRFPTLEPALRDLL